MAREYILIIVITVTESRKGVWGFPGNAFVDIQTLCLRNMFQPKAGVIKADTHTNSYMLQSESVWIHPKILTRKSESVLIHFPKRVTQTP